MQNEHSSYDDKLRHSNPQTSQPRDFRKNPLSSAENSAVAHTLVNDVLMRRQQNSTTQAIIPQAIIPQAATGQGSPSPRRPREVSHLLDVPVATVTHMFPRDCGYITAYHTAPPGTRHGPYILVDFRKVEVKCGDPQCARTSIDGSNVPFFLCNGRPGCFSHRCKHCLEIYERNRPVPLTHSDMVVEDCPVGEDRLVSVTVLGAWR